MESEFDREKDNGGWGPTGRWNPLSVQLESIILAGKRVSKEKERKKKMEGVRKRIERLVKDKRKQLTDRASLGERERM